MFQELFDAQTLQIIYRITLAVALGMLIGFEREYRGKPAGLRTYMLVALGAALFTVMSVFSFQSELGKSSFDPSRIASQVVVGIGFIGGGLIVLRGPYYCGRTLGYCSNRNDRGIWIFYCRHVFNTSCPIRAMGFALI
jgi:uncharacterized membrane protein YhiD involved in acid resistance